VDVFESVMELRAKGLSAFNYAVFDADNTIWHNDVAEATLAYMARHDTTPTAQEDFGRYYSLLKSGDKRTAYRFCALTLEGLSCDEIDHIVRRAMEDEGTEITETELFGRTIAKGIALRENVITLKRRLQACGIDMWVVTASSQLVVSPAMRYFGIEAKLIGVRNVLRDGKVIRELQEPLSIFEGKVACIQELISPSVRPLLGVGDSMNDLPMLKHSQLRAVVDSDDALAMVAKEEGWFLL
jgi:HAD superfamily phosphoserine phosphatase-like hydrolase